jgi:hypothetical protein
LASLSCKATSFSLAQMNVRYQWDWFEKDSPEHESPPEALSLAQLGNVEYLGQPQGKQEEVDPEVQEEDEHKSDREKNSQVVLDGQVEVMGSQLLLVLFSG